MSIEQVKKLAQKDRAESKGAKVRYSPETKQAAFDAVKAGATTKSVQKASGVSYPTVLSWTKGAKGKKRSSKPRSKKAGRGRLIQVSPDVYDSLKTLGVEFEDVSERDVVLSLLN